MLCGNLIGILQGTEQICFDYEVTGSAVSSISTGNILNGNEDEWYTIIVRHIGAAAGTQAGITFNGDSAASHYGWRGVNAANSTLSDVSSTALSYIPCSIGTNGYSALAVLRVYAKSGMVRLVNSSVASDITGTTVTSITPNGSVWNNTADNIISVQLICSSGTGLGVGTRLIILKSNNFTNGTPSGAITSPYVKGAWTRVGRVKLASQASSVTFTGLDGNRDVLYSASYSWKNAYAGNSLALFYPNNDTTNYGYQRVYAGSTSIAADSNANATGNRIGAAYQNDYCSGNILMFAKQGFVRPFLNMLSQGISGPAISYLVINGGSWSVTNTNMTSLVFQHAQANGFAAGSQFDLYALRPNG